MALMQQKVYLLQTTTTETRGVLRGPRGPKGRHQWKKNVFFRALPESPKPPPLTPIRATWSFFFGRQKRRFSAYYRTK